MAVREERKSQQRSLEQERAAHAWTCVQRQKSAEKTAREYGALARSAPADIQANGLGQTLAFWRAKGTSPHQALFRDLSSWLLKQLKLSGQKDALEWIVNVATTEEYRRATAEAIALLTWVKRFAEAELPKGEPGTD